MSVPLVKKLPRPGSCAPAVLITKEDLDALRAHALPASKELPRCLPASAPAVRPSAPGRTASPTRESTSQPFPSAQRRTRSASSRRRPTCPAANPGLPVSQNVGELAEFCGAVKPTRIVRSQQLTSLNRIEKKPADAKAQQAFRTPGGNANRAANNTGNTSVAGNGAAVHSSVAAPKLELCGFGSKALRTEPAQPERDQGALRLLGASPAPCLQISGLAAVVNHHPAAASDSPPPVCSKSPDWAEEEWVSSEDETTAGNEAPVDSEGETFQYRKYRYSQTARARAPEPVRKRAGARRVAQTRGSTGDAGVESDDEFSCWAGADDALDLQLSARRPGTLVPGSSQCSTPCCELEDDRADDVNLKRVAEVLVRFYGLADDLTQAVRFRHDISNVVIVEDIAWAQRKRPSAFDAPPMVWVRGGRVYDFHGDRGTLAEFEHDLLVRQVEDDSVCRMRRREQGLMPYPFLALPLKERSEDPT